MKCPVSLTSLPYVIAAGSELREFVTSPLSVAAIKRRLKQTSVKAKLRRCQSQRRRRALLIAKKGGVSSLYGSLNEGGVASVRLSGVTFVRYRKGGVAS